MRFRVWVTPFARKSEVVRVEGDELIVRLHAIPEKGKANEALIALLAEYFGVPKRSVSIDAGRSGRVKYVSIERNDVV